MARVPRSKPMDPGDKAEAGPTVVGEVVMAPLASVKPNPWNPNEMTEFELSSLAHGFKMDGWLKSMSLLVWGTDENGVQQNIIIDGEQRWTVAPRAGFVEGPMVFLDGLTMAKAKALTIKLDQKRGHFNRDKLTDLLQELQFEMDVPDMALDLGIDTEALMQHLADDAGTMTGGEAAPPDKKRGAKALSGKTQEVSQGVAANAEHVRMVQLFFSASQHDEFQGIEEKLKAKFGLKATTDIVLEAMRRAANPA